MRAERRVALVTGASRGIGRATALRLGRLGMQVVVGYHSDASAAEGVVAELDGDNRLACRVSIDDDTSVRAAAALVADRYGRLDVLVNSGGSTRPVPANDLDALDDEFFDRVLRINLRGPFAMIRALRPLLEKGEGAVVVNVSSLSARTGVGSNLAYCAAKGGLDTLTVGLARVLAPGIRVFSVSPAGVDTDFVEGRSRADLEARAAVTPLAKVTLPDDVARAIEAAVTHFTSSTGIVLMVDEGRHL